MGGWDLFFAAVIGVLTALLPIIIEKSGRTKKFRPALANLQNTMRLIRLQIEELVRMNQQRHDKVLKGVIHEFNEQLKEGDELVIKCKAIPRWDMIKKCKYAKRLAELNSSLCSRLNVACQIQQLVRNSNEKCDCMKLHTS